MEIFTPSKHSEIETVDCSDRDIGYSCYHDVNIAKKSLKIRVYSTHKLHSCPNENIILLHGAGLSSLSFSLMVKVARAVSSDKIAFHAIDLRGHGHSSDGDRILVDKYGSSSSDVNDKAIVDLSISTMVNDVIDALCLLFPANAESDCKDTSIAASSSSQESPTKSLMIVGHSMGGAVATKLCNKENIEILTKSSSAVPVGLCVLDVVEGTALESLDHAKESFKSRPVSFTTIAEAVGWSIESGMLKNEDSANISIPDQLVEEKSQDGKVIAYQWRTDVYSSHIFWPEWFKGLSEEFLFCPLKAKLLILAGTDRLDGKLMGAHMGGKFQLIVVPEVKIGHFVHEDAPQRIAHALIMFMSRSIAMSKTTFKVIPSKTPTPPPPTFAGTPSISSTVDKVAKKS